MRAIIHNKRLLLLIFALGLINLFVNNWAISLWDQDEAAYAGFSQVMLQTGNWVVPDFLWSEFHRKTPFHFWAIACSFLIFGKTEFAVRFPSSLAVVLTCITLFFLGKNVFGRENSLAACVIMCCSLFLPNLGKISVTDALLLFFETTAILSIFNYLKKPTFKCTCILWISASLGLLVKGPPILILTISTIGLLLLFHPDRCKLISLHFWIFLPLALVPLYIWGRMAWLSDDGAYIRWMIDWYILKRASGGTAFGQWGPPGYFLLVFLISFLPWAIFLPKALADLVKNFWTKQREPFYLFIGIWLFSGWFLYELIPSKLPSYALGAYPAVAIILAKQILELRPGEMNRLKSLRFGSYLFLFSAMLLSIILLIAAIIFLDNYGICLTLIVALTWQIISIFSFFKIRSGYLETGLKATAFNGLLLIFLAWVLIVPSFENHRSAPKRIAALIEQTTSKETQVIFSRPFYIPSLPFYVAQTDRKYVGLEEKELDKIKDYYFSEQKIVIVFDIKTFLIFEAYLKQSNQQVRSLKTIEGWFSELGKITQYKIVYNY
ncbi:MAG: ArnT family glycosyltransferase [Xenococcaceae cyanobacterium]